MAELEKAEFCTDAWLANAQTIFDDLMLEYGPRIVGEKHSGVEIFSNPPAHLRRNGESLVKWSFEIAGGRARVSWDDLADAKIRTGPVDYAMVLPAARMLYPTDPEQLRQLREKSLQRLSEERRHKAEERERKRNELVSPAMQRMLLEFHNRLAVVTL